ncbi:MAG: hypothetical protein IH881_15620 [Myxococcales bacterium]|nr:hypothetical protein [Myxococcales bacterium]
MSTQEDDARLAANRDAVVKHLKAELGGDVPVLEIPGQGVRFFPAGLGQLLIIYELLWDIPEPQHLVDRIDAHVLQRLRNGQSGTMTSTGTTFAP